MMQQEQLEFFKTLLNEKLKVLVDEAQKTVDDMSEEEDKSMLPDPNDRASHESDRNFLLRIKDRERKLVLKIKEAIARIETGTYGICEECSDPISEKRLIARPVTTLCINCKTSMEEDENKLQ